MDALLVTPKSRRAPFAAVVLAAAASAVRAETPANVIEGGYVEPSVAPAVAKARAVALRKLRTPRCRRLFADFRDLAGRPLHDVLAAGNETAEEHLSRMIFRDGSGMPPCGPPRLFAFTTIGTSTVFVCPNFRLLMGDSKAGANLLIHEMLHSLGAGEAPSPGLLTSYQITSSVEWRCGS